VSAFWFVEPLVAAAGASALPSLEEGAGVKLIGASAALF
tara:strand:- start:531 stop:647 length:117 start_codon:yes stop_codon:yes gene_type:complete